jgi:pyridoxamine 5'-phosphate oxidase
MERQVIIKGICKKLLKVSSDNYFDSRPEGSKLGAVVSNQSEVVLLACLFRGKFTAIRKDFSSMVIPRPKHWYLVVPEEVEGKT